MRGILSSLKTIVKRAKKLSLGYAGAIVVLVAAVAFGGGLLADQTTWGAALSAKASGFLSNLGVKTDSKLPEDLNYASVEEAYDKLRAEYNGDLDQKSLLDGLKKGLAAATGDPYTVYLSEDEAKTFSESLNNEFSGIGAEIAIKNKQLQVVTPIEGTPAAKAGLRPGDLIFTIDGEETSGLFIEQAVAKIRGEAGSKVKLTLGRDGEVIEVEVIREKISVPNARGEVLEGNIGYLKVNTFGERAVSETNAIAKDFKARGVNKIVLDLRGNGGGLLDAAVDIAGLWLDNDVVVEQRGHQGGVLRSSGRGAFYGIETVVLINKGSASASEIVAGALKDHKAATIVGETSFGKGSVQDLANLNSGGQLKVTIARWFTPGGQNIDKEGIDPDTKIELTNDDFNNNRDPQLTEALRLLLE